MVGEIVTHFFIIIYLRGITKMRDIPSGPQMSFHSSPYRVKPQGSLPVFGSQLF